MDISLEALEQAVERIKNAQPLETIPYYTAGTGIPDDIAVWLFRDTNILVITRDGSRWLRGAKVK